MGIGWEMRISGCSHQRSEANCAYIFSCLIDGGVQVRGHDTETAEHQKPRLVETRDWECLFVVCGGCAAVRGRKLAGGNNPVIVCNLIWSEPGQSLGFARPRRALPLTAKSGKVPWGLFIIDIFIVVSTIVPLFNN